MKMDNSKTVSAIANRKLNIEFRSEVTIFAKETAGALK